MYIPNQPQTIICFTSQYTQNIHNTERHTQHSTVQHKRLVENLIKINNYYTSHRANTFVWMCVVH